MAERRTYYEDIWEGSWLRRELPFGPFHQPGIAVGGLSGRHTERNKQGTATRSEFSKTHVGVGVNYTRAIDTLQVDYGVRK